MEKKKLEWIIKMLKEEMAAGDGPPTNHTGPQVAEFSPLMGGVQRRKKRKPTPVGRYGTRRTWKKGISEGEIADKLKEIIADMKDADRKAGLLPGGKDVIDLDVERQRRRKKK